MTRARRVAFLLARRVVDLAALGFFLLVAWITIVGGWLGLVHDSWQAWRELTGASPVMCVKAAPPAGP